MIKTLGNPANKRYMGDTAGLIKLQSQGMILRYEVQTGTPEYAVMYLPRSRRDPMPWVQVGGLESRLRSTEIIALDAQVFAAWEAERDSEASAETVEIVAPPTGLPKCIHGRHMYKSLRTKLIPVCAEGAQYGVWDINDAGFLHVVDCAQDAVTWAAEQMYDEPDYEMVVLSVCRKHDDQPAAGCEECDSEGCGAVDPEDWDACGECQDCNPAK